MSSEIAAGASVTSGHDVSQPEEENQSPAEGLEGEEKEDLPEQPPPVVEKPKEGKMTQILAQVNDNNKMRLIVLLNVVNLMYVS